MSFSICRIEKIKLNGVTGIQIHDRREKNVSHTNKDIDWSRTHENIDLLQQQEKFRRVVQSRIDELDLPRAIRKDATVMVQTMITSDNKFFDKMNKVEQINFFEKSYDFIKNRYGEKNMVSAIIHFDETTPHLHVNFVPVTDDGRLSARDLFSPKKLRQLQDDFNKYVNDHGYDLERGKLDSKRKHLNVEEYKLETKFSELKTKENELDKKINDLVSERDAIRNELNAFKSDLKDIEGIRVAFDDINAVEVKYGAFNKGILNDVEGFEDVKLLAKKAALLESEVADKNRYIRNLEIDNKKLMKYTNPSSDKRHDVQREKEKYKKAYENLFDYVKSKDEVDEAIKFSQEKNRLEKEMQKNEINEMHKNLDDLEL